MIKRWLTVPEGTTLAGISRQLMWNMIIAGQIESKKNKKGKTFVLAKDVHLLAKTMLRKGGEKNAGI